jgi:hypothetical protein
MAVQAQNLIMDNVQIVNGSQNQGCGELFIKCEGQCDINNVYLGDYKPGGSGSVPNSRVRFRFGQPYDSLPAPIKAHIKQLRVIGYDTTAGNWAAASFDPGYTSPAAIVAYEPAAVQCTFENCEIKDFTENSIATAAVGFSLIDAASGALYDGGSTAGENLQLLSNLVLKEYNIQNCYMGVKGLFDLGTAVVSYLWFDKCYFGFNYKEGLYISSTNSLLPIGRIMINNCVFHANGIDGLSPGLEISSWEWDGDAVMITGCTAYDNVDSLAGTVQALLATNTTSGTGSPEGTFIGNNLLSSTGANQNLQVKARNVGSPTLVSATTSMRGIETSYDSSGAVVNASNRQYGDGVSMLFNCGLLTNDGT